MRIITKLGYSTHSPLVVGFFNLAASLPLRILHRIGAMMSWATYWLSASYARRLRENLACAYPDLTQKEFRQMLHANIAETGKGGSELAWVWRRPLDQVLSKVKSCDGLGHLQAARQRGQGVIILTPHIGCFEVIGLYVAARMPMTCMYRPPRQSWMDGVMRSGRERGQMRLARTNIGGVRAMLKALKRGEVIGLLPDQVPAYGEGEWAEFFGRPAYTMTLVGRLIEASGATVLMSYSLRLPQGTGYAIHILPLELSSAEPVTRQINAALEKVIRSCPAQYLWSYNRYKIPAGVLPPQKNNPSGMENT